MIIMNSSNNIAEMYDKISNRFDTSRVRIWNNVKLFVSYTEDTKKLLDAGCGNGKNSVYAIENNYDVIGIDISDKLLDISASKNIRVYKKNLLELDYYNMFDKCICIAVIHHLDTLENQYLSIINLVNSLKKYGELLISVWSYEKTNIIDKNDTYTNEKYRNFIVGNNKVSWVVDNNEIIERYYYIHNYETFTKLINMVNNTVKISYNISWEKQNWFCKIKKL